MSDPELYTVGWICAIATEFTAACQFLDREHGLPIYVAPNDSNGYALGEMAGHNVVIAVLPCGEYGLSSAASVAANMLNSFPNIRFGLMVGIGGGAPTLENDIRLGDVVVSFPKRQTGGVYQYDYGKMIQGRGFQRSAFLNQPPQTLLTAINVLKSKHEAEGHRIEDDIAAVLKKRPRLRSNYNRPNQLSDRLYKAHVIHPYDNKDDCERLCGTQEADLVRRDDRGEDKDGPVIHYGVIASANQLIKDASTRDILAKEEDILCFEMEAAGLMNRFPCLVIRGICDYSDSHKNKKWQGYAAMTAAAYTKGLLRRIVPSRVVTERKIVEVLAKEFVEEFRVKGLRVVAPETNSLDECSNCGLLGHRASECFARPNTVEAYRRDSHACLSCGKKDHWQASCPTWRYREGYECFECCRWGHWKEDCFKFWHPSSKHFAYP